MKIREATVNDIQNIIELVQYSYKFSYRGYLPDEYLDGLCITEDVLQKWLGYIQKNECYVFETQSQIVAFMMLESNKETKICEICILYVKPDYQKQGIGSLMVDYVCDIKRKQNYNKCEVWTIKNGPSINFYGKIGFVLMSEEKAWKFDIPIIKMVKEL